MTFLEIQNQCRAALNQLHNHGSNVCNNFTILPISVTSPNCDICYYSKYYHLAKQITDATTRIMSNPTTTTTHATVEASSVYLAPGHWPKTLKYNNRTYHRLTELLEIEPHGGARYTSFSRGTKFTLDIIND